MHLVATTTPIGIAVSRVRDGALLFANESYRRLIGIDHREADIERVKTFYENIEERKALIADLHRLGKIDNREIKIRHIDGGAFDGVVDASFISFGGERAICVSVVDASKAKAAERREREIGGILTSIADASPLTMTVRDLDNRYILVNKAFLELVGRSLPEVIGKTVDDVFDSEEAEIREDMTEEVLRTETARTYDVVSSDGASGERVMQITTFPIWDNERSLIATGSIGLDISRGRQLEQQLNQVERLETIGQLTGGIAHDFNNILAVVIGSAEIMLERPGDATQVRRLSRNIETAAARGANLIQRMLTFARRQPLEAEPIDLEKVVGETIALASRMLPESIEIETKFDGELWLAKADRSQVENAMLNLMINARDAMPDGGQIVVAVRKATVDDTMSGAPADLAPGEYLRITVSDTGTGMPSDVAKNAFDPFFTTKELHRRTGLGLSMVYGFARQSGGTAHIYSVVDEGTTVSVYLPRTKASAITEATAEPEEPLRVKNLTVLLVEDDTALRTLARGTLDQLGCTVIEAPDGPSALQILEQRPDIDLLFTDNVMPGGISGRDLAGRAAAQYPRLKVLLTSGYAEYPSPNHRTALADRFEMLGKPYPRSELIKKLNYLFNTGGGASRG